jgi:hypothetical protein
MALWEMGVRQLRIPLSDLRHARTRERMRALRRNGQAFTVYSRAVLSDNLRDLLLEHADLVDGWEVIAPLRGLDGVVPDRECSGSGATMPRSPSISSASAPASEAMASSRRTPSA